MADKDDKSNYSTGSEYELKKASKDSDWSDAGNNQGQSTQIVFKRKTTIAVPNVKRLAGADNEDSIDQMVEDLEEEEEKEATHESVITPTLPYHELKKLSHKPSKMSNASHKESALSRKDPMRISGS